MAEPLDPARIGAALRSRTPPLTLILQMTEEAPFADSLRILAESLDRHADGGIRLEWGAGAGLPATPALSIGASGRGWIHHLALPEGHEVLPFEEILLEREAVELSAEFSARIKSLDHPAELLVFIASACPHCPRTVCAAAALALASPQVTLSIVDAQRFPELAERYGVVSAPTTIVDGELTWIGEVEAGELVELLLGRGTPEHEARAFQSLVASGRLDAAVERILAGPGAEHFLAAWRRSATSDRIGLMLLAERTLDRDAQALNGIVGRLVTVLAAEDPALRGDTADLLGRIGHPDARIPLQALLNDANPDVVEIAEEALDALEG